MFAATRAGLSAILAVAVALVSGAVDAAASTPPSSTVPLGTGGVLAGPGGGFEVSFTAAPIVVADPAGSSTSYLIGVEEDTETVSVLAPTAFGAAPEATAAERALLFLDASGDEIEMIANTQTRLGPFPAAYFIARITLADGKRAVVYGVAVVRPGDVTYVFFTDVGGDDGERGRAFVESYTVVIDPFPAPTTTTATTTTVPTATTAAAPTSPTTTVSAVVTTSATTTTVPEGVLASVDGRWSIRLPDGAVVALRASSQDGFAYTEYVSVVGDDTLSVRVTELPLAFEWSPAGAAALDAQRTGSSVVGSTLTSIDGAPGARFTLVDADSDTSGDTTEVLLVRSGGQLYRIAYADGGESSTAAAATFIDSFQLR